MCQTPAVDDGRSRSLTSRPPSATQHEQIATFWTSESGWDTELRMKNNLPADSLEVTPVLRFASGQELSLDAVSVPPNSSVSLSVNDALQKRAPNLVGQLASYGSVSFRFISPEALNLHATAVPSLKGVPVAFSIKARPGKSPIESVGNGRQNSLEGFWWRARSGLTDVVIVSNSSEASVFGTLSIFDADGKKWSEPVSLTAHETRRLEINDLILKAGLGGNFGGISIETPALADSLSAVHLMYDEGGKFSSSSEMFHRDPGSSLVERLGSNQKQWVMRAPMLALQSPDPALGLPATTTMQPTLLVRNTTGHAVVTNITLNWRRDSKTGRAKVPELELAPFETRKIDIWRMQSKLGVPSDAHWALVSLSTNAAPDDVIAIASSRDCTGTYSVDTNFSGGLGGYLVGGEWRADNTHTQIAAITNVGTQSADALLTLHYYDGTAKYELQQSIAPGDQMWVNLSELIQKRVADRNGNFLPTNVSTVTATVEELAPQGNGNNLVADDLAVDVATGSVVPHCASCCGYTSLVFFPSAEDLDFNTSDTVGVNGLNPCNDVVYNITANFTSWSSSNANVAKLTTAKVQGLAVGVATGMAQGLVEGPGQCACNYTTKQVTLPITVIPVIQLGGSGGTVVNGKTTSVVVGQKIVLYGSYALPVGVSANSLGWNIPGIANNPPYAVGNYAQSNASGAVTLVNNSTQTVTFYYVTPGTYTVVFNLNYGSNQTAAASTTFKVTAPTATPTVALPTSGKLYVNTFTGCTNNPSGPYLVFGNLTGPVVGCGGTYSGSAGITFTPPTTTTPPGTFYFTQIVTSDQVTYNAQVCTATNTPGLDGNVPYQNKTGQLVTDAPNSPLPSSYSSSSRNFSATMYFMWQSNTANSIPVALGHVNWQVSGSTTQSGGKWATPTGSGTSSGYVANATYPQWTGLVGLPNTNCH